MARTKGQLNFSANIEVKKQAALDARTVVATVADLTTAATWQDSDGAVWLYDGLVVAVSSTGELWMLTDKDNYTQTASWKRIDGGGVEAGVESVTSGSGAIEVGGTTAKPTVGLKLDGTGNVKLTQAASGLKAEYKPIATQLAELVKDGDQVLHVETTGQQDPAKLAVTIGLDYNSGTKKITLTGINDAVIAEIDAADFIKDGMVQSVELEGNNLVITFNTDAGAEPISVDLSKFLDVYTAGNGITISGKSIAVKPYMGLVADSNGVAVNINSGDKYLGFNAGALVSKGIDEAIETAVSQALTWTDVGE